jgi:hypothetical protein
MPEIVISLIGNTQKKPVCNPNPAPTIGSAQWTSQYEWEVKFTSDDPVSDKKVKGKAGETDGITFTDEVFVGQRIKYQVRVKKDGTWYGDDPELIVDE